MSRITQIFAQYFDDAGDPLISGKIYFYDSGTLDAKNTYADINLTIANPNPVILSAAGRQPNIFFEGTAKAILTDSGDVQIEVRDPVSGSGGDSGAFADWNALTIYDSQAVVTGSDGLYYNSIDAANVGHDPVTTTGFWQEIRFINVWDTAYTYAAGNVAIASDDNLYVSRVASNIGNNPTSSPTEWRVLTADFSSPPPIGDVAPDTGAFTDLSSSNVADFSAAGINLGDEDLANYDEGTFTPVLSDGTNNATTDVENGFYTRIGNRVFFDLSILTSSLGSVSGSLRITGLPFAAAGGHVAVAVGQVTGMSLTAGVGVQAYVAGGQSYIFLLKGSATSGTSSLTDSQWTADGKVQIAGNYKV